MPTYTYHCIDCDETFEQAEHIAEHEQSRPRCPRCRGERVESVITSRYVKTSKKS